MSGIGPISSHGSSVRISVHAQPGAKRTRLAGQHGDAIKISVHAPPLEGRANDELIRFIAELLGVARSHVSLVRGDKGRAKVFAVEGVSEARVRSILLGTLN